MTDRARLRGLIAAAFTPMTAERAVDVDAIPAVADAVLAQGADGLFVCGSSGEFNALTTAERMDVAAAYLAPTRGRAPVVVHVGSDALPDVRALAEHARAHGADAMACLPPTWMKPSDLDALVDFVVTVAAFVPDLPLLYYHIPALSGVTPPLVEFAERVRKRAPSISGIKFSSPQLDQLILCLDAHGDALDLLFGVDEMLLAGLACGAHGAVGSTYNMLGDVNQRMVAATARGDMDTALAEQRRATRAVHAMLRYGGLGGIKAGMLRLGLDCGPPRAPHRAVSAERRDELRAELAAILDD